MEDRLVEIKAYYRVCPYCKEKVITLQPDAEASEFFRHIFEDCKVYKALRIIKPKLPATVSEFKEQYGHLL